MESDAKKLLREARGRGYVLRRNDEGRLAVTEPPGGTADAAFVERLRAGKAGLLAALIGEEMVAASRPPVWRHPAPGPLPEIWTWEHYDTTAYWQDRMSREPFTPYLVKRVEDDPAAVVEAAAEPAPLASTDFASPAAPVIGKRQPKARRAKKTTDEQDGMFDA